MKEYDVIKFKKKLKEEREKAGLSVNKATSLIGCDHRCIPDWEDLDNEKLPSFRNLTRLCNYYQCDIDYLFGNLDEKNHTHAFICKETGLSEGAVKILCSLQSDPDQDHAPERKLVIDTINALLENTVNQEMIDENGLFTSPVYQIGEYIGLTSPPTISGQDKVFVKFNVGTGSVSNLESVRELYAERTMRLITSGLNKIKEIIASKKRNH